VISSQGRTAILLALLTLVGCGSEAHVIVQLRSLADEDPYAGLDQMVITLSGDGERVGKVTTPWDGTPIELPSPGDVSRVSVAIEGQSATGQILSQGSAKATVREGTACCLFVCFCSNSRFSTDACGCGEDRCVPSCDAGP
jgi:hypothetical protein